MWLHNFWREILNLLIEKLTRQPMPFSTALTLTRNLKSSVNFYTSRYIVVPRYVYNHVKNFGNFSEGQSKFPGSSLSRFFGVFFMFKKVVHVVRFCRKRRSSQFYLTKPSSLLFFFSLYVVNPKKMPIFEDGVSIAMHFL